ncbi:MULTISPECIES: inovirus Gp2 family protein [Providencia]|uniref:inovirus Gp2 family protein n=1 Tax=Providencia TaxID=586 RepID=UPI000CFEAF22|nr:MULTISPECIES: inovirus Gp2 family protein [Providencia]AVL75965.1 inovirus Gp2 family protein [Providencia rettgeri]QLQ63584.1 inovirus Gp2 family protein [Providencia rettgeri]URR22459.1 inovirus Gp2 family protein [Providencia rettgeri]
MKEYSYNKKYQNVFVDVINQAVDEFPRTLALRVDLRFPANYNYSRSSREITRFIESLKAKLSVDCLRKNKLWGRRWRNRLRYIWVRETGNSNRRKHYHALLLLNKDLYHGAGKFDSDNSLAALIQQAWYSALGLDSIMYSSLVHFPVNGVFHLNINKEDYEQKLNQLLKRMEYLAKDYTKNYDDGYRSIGRSK